MIMFITLSSNAQSRIGFTYDEIYQEFINNKPTVKKIDDGTLMLEISMEHTITCYFFDQDGSCVLTAIGPKSQEDFNMLVRMYNKDYIIVSSKEWKMYARGAVLKIILDYTDNGSPYFFWEEEQ